MASIDVLDWNKKTVGSVDLSAEVFEQPVRKDVLQALVRWQLAKRRQGTHQAKDRSEVSGGGKKPFKQKGTGNARQGSIRSPLMPGGAVIFGPRPRSYAYTLPRQYRRLGLRNALSYLFSEGRIHVVDSMNSEGGKTKELAQRLKGFGAEKAVLIDVQVDEKFKRASQNLGKFKYYTTAGLNVFDLLKFNHLIITKSAVEPIVARCRAES